MTVEEILANLKELTLDFVNKKRTRGQTVLELQNRINPDDIYKMDKSVPERDFITEVYVSLDNLITEDFAPSFEEIKYFSEVFEGKRTFSKEEVRQFTIGSFERGK